MTRKNLKIAEDTYGELKDEKRDMETWDGMLQRLLRNTAEHESSGGCVRCGDGEDGDLCAECWELAETS